MAEQRDDPTLVPVLTTTDPGLLLIAKSVLDAVGIPYVVQGEAGVSLFPLGAAGGRVTGRITGAVLRVGSEHLEEARALLTAENQVPHDEA